MEVPIVETTTSEDREMFSVTLTSDAHNIVVDPSNATIIIEGLGMRFNDTKYLDTLSL